MHALMSGEGHGEPSEGQASWNNAGGGDCQLSVTRGAGAGAPTRRRLMRLDVGVTCEW